MSHTHLNVYDGRDVQLCGTATAWVIRAFEGLLPEPEISPTCKRKGHDWTPEVVALSTQAPVKACERCMKRGLLVFETRDARSTGSEPK